MKKMMIVLTVIGIAAAGCKSQGRDSARMADQLNAYKFDKKMEKDADFCTDAIIAGMLEMRLAELVKKNGSSEAVKGFGRTMMRDHKASNEELKHIARNKKIIIPASLSETDMEMYRDLSEENGGRFDRAYADFVVKNHEKTLRQFREEAKDGNDSTIKRWARNHVPTMEHHMQMARDMQTLVKQYSYADEPATKQ